MKTTISDCHIPAAKTRDGMREAMTKTVTIWLTGCTSIDTALSDIFFLDLNADLSKEEVMDICRQCNEAEKMSACTKEPVQVKLTITAEKI